MESSDKQASHNQVASSPTKEVRSSATGLSGLFQNEQLRVVALFALFSGAGGMVALGAPTGIDWWDAVLRFLVAAIVSLAASQSHKVAWFALAAVGFIFSGTGLVLVFALAALLVSLLSFLAKSRDQMVGAAVGALAMQGLLRLPTESAFGFTPFFGLTALASGLAMAAVIGSAYITSGGAARRFAKGLGVATVILLVVGVGSLLITGVRAQGPLRDAIDASNNGRTAASQGDQPGAVDALTTASEKFGESGDAVSGPLSAPARLLPVVSQHLRMFDAATAEGMRVTDAGARVASDADLELLRPKNGAVDLSLFAPVAEGLAETAQAITAARSGIADARSPWLLPPVADQLDELETDLEAAGSDATLGVRILDRLPTVLGADRPQRYMALFGTPSESRELGGFIGAYAVLEANNGAISLVEVGENADLNERAAAEGPLGHPDGYPQRYNEYLIEKFPGNISGTPDPLTVARATDDMFPSIAGAPIDGIIYLDAFAIQAFVELIGAIKPTALTEPLTGENTADFFLRQQYRLFPDREERTDFLVFLIEKTFAAVLDRPLPGPERMGEVLGPVARQGRLQVATFDTDTNDLLRELFLLRDFPRPIPGEDFLSVVQANGASNKLDSYLNRKVDYTVSIDPNNSTINAVASITLTLDTPSDLPAYVVGDETEFGLPIGSNRVLLSIYTPHELTRTTVDGDFAPTNNQIEYGFRRHLVSVDVAPGVPTTVEFHLSGSLDIGDEYALQVSAQPLVNSDEMTITVLPPASYALAGGDPGRPVTTSVLLDQDTRFGWLLD